MLSHQAKRIFLLYSNRVPSPVGQIGRGVFVFSALQKGFMQQITRIFYSADELEVITGIKKPTWRKWTRQKKVRHHKFGRSVKFDLNEVLDDLHGAQEEEK